VIGLRVNVGSHNAAKLEAVRLGLGPFFERLELTACDVEGGVSDQPLGFDEIVTGARNRAIGSFGLGNCDLAAGIEDGLVPVAQLPTGYVNLGCCVLYDGNQAAYGFSSGFEYPPTCVSDATGFPRAPIGAAFDRLIAHRPQAVGDPWRSNVGHLTRGLLSRADYGSHAVICAWVRFLHPDLYERAGGASS